MAKKARDPTRFDWDDIRIFLAVAECRSMRNAAKRLDMHHSTVARRIVSLECATKRKLLTADLPGKATCELTHDGLKLVSLAHDMFVTADKINTEMQR